MGDTAGHIDSQLDEDAAEVARAGVLEVAERLPHPQSMMLP